MKPVSAEGEDKATPTTTPLTDAEDFRRTAEKIVNEWFPTERGKRPLIDAIAAALTAVRAGSQPANAVKDASMRAANATIFCEQCAVRVPLIPVRTIRTSNNQQPWADVVCPTCHFVIVTITTDLEGLYGLAALTTEPKKENNDA